MDASKQLVTVPAQDWFRPRAQLRCLMPWVAHTLVCRTVDGGFNATSESDTIYLLPPISQDRKTLWELAVSIRSASLLNSRSYSELFQLKEFACQTASASWFEH